VACRRASPRRPCPIPREISATAPIISPMPTLTDRNWMAKENPIAAIRRGSPSREIQ